MLGMRGGGTKTSLSDLHHAFSNTNQRWGSVGNRKPWTKLRVPGTAGRTDHFRDNPGNSWTVGNYVYILAMHTQVYVRARTSTPELGAVCAHVHAPLAGRPRIKMASFYVCCNELHDLPKRYSAGEKRSLDVRAHL